MAMEFKSVQITASCCFYSRGFFFPVRRTFIADCY